jgi:hypothetical protein
MKRKKIVARMPARISMEKIIAGEEALRSTWYAVVVSTSYCVLRIKASV